MAGQTLPAPLVRPNSVAPDSPESETETLYVTFYLQGPTPFPKFKLFKHRSKNIQVITAAAKRYFEQRGGRHVRTEPVMIDIMDLSEGDSL